ncbi:hypothetical protein M9Y10_041272 [Tritrichomonas musculus]|uniref:EF-hand domain-containing protein n=1 Tax=Tritrichomonas musculus TaxID=1915356 RepID=A0ABR2K3X3_9EUKA
MEFYDLNPLSSEQAIEAQNDFKAIDKDGNGQLDSDELFEYISKFKPELRSFSNLIIRVFGDGNTINWSQFYYSYRSFTAKKEADNYILKLIFKFIDTDNSGTISGKEYREVFDYFIAPGHNQQKLLNSMSYGEELDYDAFAKRFIDDTEYYWKICSPNQD